MAKGMVSHRQTIPFTISLSFNQLQIKKKRKTNIGEYAPTTVRISSDILLLP